jgi:hypothetical protein
MAPLILSLFLIVQAPSLSTDSTPLTRKIYVTNINKGTPNAYRAYLKGINDTSVYLSKQPQPYGSSSFDNTVPYHIIENLTVHKKGGAGKGAIWGGLSGIAFGAIVGAITYKPCSDCFFDFGVGFNMFAGALLGMLPGVGVGLIIGGRKQRFQIRGSRENFDQMRSKLSRVYGERANE